MEQKQRLRPPLALNEVFVGSRYTLTSDILRDVRHSERSQQRFQRSFLNFVTTVGVILQLPIDRREALDLIFTTTVLIDRTPDEFVRGFMLKEFEQSKRREEYMVLFQNAFVYAVAACYKSRIIKTYMRASHKSERSKSQNTEYMLTSKVNGSYLVGSPDDRAKHSDEEYVQYVVAVHPLLAAFVKSKNRFQSKKILTVIGYLINPYLAEEK